MTRLSIALATYNGAAHLPVQLASFAAQERLPDELMVCDDRSTDATVKIIEDFARTVPFEVRVSVNRSNIGHELNFGKVIDLATGDIIFLADQDDCWNPDRLKRVEEALAAVPDALLLVNDVMITDGDLNPLGRTVTGQMQAAGVLGSRAKSLTLGCATAFRAELRAFVSPVPSLNYGHDSWLHEFCDMLGGRRVLREVLQLYRRHESNVSNWAFNSTEKASPAVVMQPSAGQDLTAAYDNRLRALRLMRSRVVALGQAGHDRINRNRGHAAVLAEFDHAIAAVERRKAIFRKSRLVKSATAVALWLRGDYRYFLGWRSLAKDLIR